MALSVSGQDVGRKNIQDKDNGMLVWILRSISDALQPISDVHDVERQAGSFFRLDKKHVHVISSGCIAKLLGGDSKHISQKLL